MHLDKIEYAGWEDCLRLRNGRVELVTTTVVGPRIIRFGFTGQQNLLKEEPDQSGLRGGGEWRIYGGHRLWHAPENEQRTYVPDNQPVPYQVSDGRLILTPPVEQATGIQKEIHIRPLEIEGGFEITHRMWNHNPWTIEFSVWALTVMAPSGVAILPHPPRRPWPEQLLPSHGLVLWSYTDMADPRWTWGEKFILLRQDVTRPASLKLGMISPPGWLAYALGNHLFLKQIASPMEGVYPDLGSAVEVFTNDRFLELETLSPLTRVEPGNSVTLVERWYLLEDVNPPTSEQAVETEILPRIQALLKLDE
jgi:hypothetical protein